MDDARRGAIAPRQRRGGAIAPGGRRARPPGGTREAERGREGAVRGGGRAGRGVAGGRRRLVLLPGLLRVRLGIRSDNLARIVRLPSPFIARPMAASTLIPG